MPIEERFLRCSDIGQHHVIHTSIATSNAKTGFSAMKGPSCRRCPASALRRAEDRRRPAPVASHRRHAPSVLRHAKEPAPVPRRDRKMANSSDGKEVELKLAVDGATAFAALAARRARRRERQRSRSTISSIPRTAGSMRASTRFVCARRRPFHVDGERNGPQAPTAGPLTARLEKAQVAWRDAPSKAKRLFDAIKGLR
jgi:hypothetical protein